MYINPIVVLAGAAVNSGNRWFAIDLLTAGQGVRHCKAIKRKSRVLKGLPCLTIAAIQDDKVKFSAL